MTKRGIYHGFLLANCSFTELRSCSGYPCYQKTTRTFNLGIFLLNWLSKLAVCQAFWSSYLHSLLSTKFCVARERVYYWSPDHRTAVCDMSDADERLVPEQHTYRQPRGACELSTRARGVWSEVRDKRQSVGSEALSTCSRVHNLNVTETEVLGYPIRT